MCRFTASKKTLTWFGGRVGNRYGDNDTHTYIFKGEEGLCLKFENNFSDIKGVPTYRRKNGKVIYAIVPLNIKALY